MEAQCVNEKVEDVFFLTGNRSAVVWNYIVKNPWWGEGADPHPGVWTCTKTWRRQSCFVWGREGLSGSPGGQARGTQQNGGRVTPLLPWPPFPSLTHPQSILHSIKIRRNPFKRQNPSMAPLTLGRNPNSWPWPPRPCGLRPLAAAQTLPPTGFPRLPPATLPSLLFLNSSHVLPAQGSGTYCSLCPAHSSPKYLYFSPSLQSGLFANVTWAEAPLSQSSSLPIPLHVPSLLWWFLQSTYHVVTFIWWLRLLEWKLLRVGFDSLPPCYLSSIWGGASNIEMLHKHVLS